MRSRDGDRSYLFTISSLILLASALSADNYLIGYRAYVRDAILVDETLSISRAMTPCYGELKSSLILDSSGEKDIYKVLKNSNDDFYHYLLKQSLHVSHKEHLINQQSHSLTTLTFPTHCFKVTFNTNLVKITLIK
jgi:hypothetical protein